jgi:nucleotide-binding universal stress UspA family protein
MMIRQALDSFCREFKADDPECSFVTDEIVVTTGKPAEEIVKQIEASGCDVVVMGYHERSMLEKAVLSGVTRKVLRRSKKPVLLVPLAEEA